MRQRENMKIQVNNRLITDTGLPDTYLVNNLLNRPGVIRNVQTHHILSEKL